MHFAPDAVDVEGHLVHLADVECCASPVLMLGPDGSGLGARR